MRHLLIILQIVLATGALSLSADEDTAKEYHCVWATGEIIIDGVADEADWKNAVVIEDFAMPWLKPPREPERRTSARLLWDRDFLYFHAEMDDSDLYADETEHDGELWYNDVFELFFKPSPEHAGYYEFQVNPNGAILDMFIPRRAAGGTRRFLKAQEFHIEARVKLDGTVNRWEDRDKGWSVEGKIPWKDFFKTGGRPEPNEIWAFHAARYDYSVDLEHGVDSSSSAPLTRYDFHRYEDYEPIRFIGPTDEQSLRLPERLKEVGPVVTSRVAGSPDSPPMYRAQRFLPDLELPFLVTIEYEPHQKKLYLGSRPEEHKFGILSRLDVESGEMETLIEKSSYVFYDLEFHPDFAANGHLFIGRNGPTEKPRHEHRTEIVRYTIDPESGDLDPDSELVIIGWTSGGHDGAALVFGGDGNLFITSGDGSNDSDIDIQGQGLDHLRSKVLRINVDQPDDDRPYSIPADNPFVNLSGARGETWAYGMRNPWRIDYDPKKKQLWVGNNGQDWLEQVYLVERGGNYGWSVYEGSKIFRAERKQGPTPILPPTLEHGHFESRSLTGGIVYDGKALSEISGAYVYGDHSTGKIWAARHDGASITWSREIADTTLAITDFEELPDGRLLVADWRRDGGLWELVPNTATDTSAEFPRKLSETGLFQSIQEHTPKPSLFPYSVNAPAWVDGASAERYLALPEEAAKPTIYYHGTDTWKLPNQSTLVQTLSLGEQRIETRILTQQENEWVGYSYQWNEDQSDASLVSADGLDKKIGEQTWRFPSRSECMICHSRAAGFVLGWNTAQLNRPHDYGGETVNQLEVLERLGWLETNWAPDTRASEQQHHGARRSFAQERLQLEKVREYDRIWRERYQTRNQRPAPRGMRMLSESPRYLQRMVDPADTSHPLELRARSYIAANCSHCHRSAGGGNSVIDLRFGLTPELMHILDAPTVHGFAGMAPGSNPVVSTKGKTSILLSRMTVRGPGQMPPICSNLPDVEGLGLLGKWIVELSKE